MDYVLESLLHLEPTSIKKTIFERIKKVRMSPLRKTLKRRYTISNRKLLLILYGILIFIHFILKDTIYPINIIYYACPVLFLLIKNLVLCVLFFREKKILYSLIGCFLCVSLYWFATYYKTQSPPELSDKDKSILFWNIARKGERSMDIIIKKTKEQKPSFIALVEAEELTDKDVMWFKNTFPSYSIQKLKGGMVLAVKGEIDDVGYHCKDESFKFNYITVTLANQKTSILVADVNAVPFMNRKSALHAIYEFTIKNNPSFIVGDFNTPYESVHFGDFKDSLNSFHKVSKGFTATWPYGIPLFEIDQIWSAKAIRPVFLKKEYYSISDHALLIGVYK